MTGIKDLYLTLRFFLFAGIVIVVFISSFAFPLLFPVAVGLLLLLFAALITDIFILFNSKVKFSCKRSVPPVFSLGSQNQVALEIENKSTGSFKVSVIDELPFQLQKRDFEANTNLEKGQIHVISYRLVPTMRGEYQFGKVNLYLTSSLSLAQRRIAFNEERMVKVYPSILEMKSLELKAFPKISQFQGVKKIRRIGHSYEFEQIKNYVRGDDFRSINWKATGRHGTLMVNQYEDEKAQQVYCIIDKSRSMLMPFNNLSLLDYAINSSLVLSNIALRKQDKAGLISFSDKVETTLRAERSPAHLRRILDALYKEEEKKSESNYEGLYLAVKNVIKGRSLVLLYTNFESYYALQRILPVLKKINKTHLLVVIFFQNSEVMEFSHSKTDTLEDIYHQAIAQKLVAEKTRIVYELRQYGIQALYTRPEDLSVNTVNKYLELKSRGLI